MILSSLPTALHQGLTVPVVPLNLVFSGTNHAKALSSTLTVYNPYPVAYRFRVTSTAVEAYSVRPSQGCIRARCSITIDVSLNDKIQSPARSKLKVELLGINDDVVKGQQIVELKRVRHADESAQRQSPSLRRSTSLRSSSPSPPTTSLPLHHPFGPLTATLRLLPLLVGVGVVALLGLGQVDSSKIWMSFCVGMVTMLIELKYIDL